MDQRGGTAVRDIMAGFNAAGTGITVTERTFPNYPELLMAQQAALAANIPPAVAQIGYADLRYLADNVPHLAIDEAARRDAAGQGTEWLDKTFTPTVLELGRVGSVLRGLPYAISVSTLFYNADLLKQAGIERPATTWADIRAQARQIKERTGKLGVYLAETSAFSTQQTFIEGNGARVLVGSGADVRTGIDGPEAIEAFQFAQDMIHKDKVAPHVPQAQGFTLFKSGELAMCLTYSSQFEDFKRSTMFTLGTAPLPTFGAKPRRIAAGGNLLFIFARDAEQQAAAWEWVKYLSGPEAVTAFIRGTGYTPPRSGVIEDPRYLKPYFDENPLQKPIVERLPEVVPGANFPGKNGPQINKELTDVRSAVLSGREVAPTLREAAQRINQLIKQ